MIQSGNSTGQQPFHPSHCQQTRLTANACLTADGRQGWQVTSSFFPEQRALWHSLPCYFQASASHCPDTGTTPLSGLVHTRLPAGRVDSLSQWLRGCCLSYQLLKPSE